MSEQFTPKCWICPKCGQPNQFGNGKCWSCGTLEPFTGIATSELDDFQKALDELRNKYREDQKDGTL